MSRREDKAGILEWVLFFIYMAILAWIILFKLSLSWSEIPHLRNINLIPYGQSVIVNGTLDISELWQNVLAFVPLGIYLGMLDSKGKIWKKVVTIAMISLGLEALQYILAVGASDITDLINNTLGGIIGLLIYTFVHFIFGRKTNTILRRIALLCTVIIIAFMTVLIIFNL